MKGLLQMFNGRTFTSTPHGGPPPEHRHFMETTQRSLSPAGTNYQNNYPTTNVGGNYNVNPFGGFNDMGIPSARVDIVRQRNTQPVHCRDDVPANTEILQHALPYVRECLEKANSVYNVGIHPAVIDFILDVLTPYSQNSNQKRQNQLSWFVLAVYNDRIQAREKPEGSPIDATDLKDGASLWCTNLIPEVVPIAEQILREAIMRQNAQRAQYAPPVYQSVNVQPGQHVGMFGSTCGQPNMRKAGFTSDPNEDYKAPDPQDAWMRPFSNQQVSQPVQQPQVVITHQGGPTVEDFDREWMNKIRTYCEQRGIEFAPNCLGLIEVNAWCQDFAAQIEKLRSEGKTYLKIEDRKKYASKLPNGEDTLIVDRDFYINLTTHWSEKVKEKYERKRAKLVIVDKPRTKPVFAQVKSHKPEPEAENAGVHTTQVFRQQDDHDVVVSSTTLDRPVTEDVYVTEDVQVSTEGIEGERFLHSVEYDKLTTIPIPTQAMVNLKELILNWHKETHNQSHGFRKGVGEYLTSLLFEKEDVLTEEHKEILIEFLIKEFNDRVRKTIRSVEDPERTFEVTSLDQLAFTDWTEVGEELNTPHLKDKIWHTLDSIVNHWILRENAIVTPDDPNAQHVLLTKESDTFLVGGRYKEDWFVSTEEDPRTFIEEFMEAYTVFRIRNQILLTNFLKAEDDEILLYPNVEDCDTPDQQLYAQALKTLYTGKDLPQLTALVKDKRFAERSMYERIRFEQGKGENSLKCFVLKRIK